MGNIENHRKKLALLLAILVLVLTVFIHVVGGSIMQFYEQLDRTEEHAQEQLEEYHELTLEINDTFLNTVENDWAVYSQHMDYEKSKEPSYYIKDFSDNFLDAVSENAFMSVIVTTDDGQVITMHYQKEAYKEIEVDFSMVPADRQVVVLNGDPDRPFGEGERYYVAGTRLKHKDIEFNVYFGYLEPVMKENFVNALDIDILSAIRQELFKVTCAVVGLLGFTVIYGIYLLYYIRRLKFVVYKEVVDEIKNGGS